MKESGKYIDFILWLQVHSNLDPVGLEQMTFFGAFLITERGNVITFIALATSVFL